MPSTSATRDLEAELATLQAPALGGSRAARRCRGRQRGRRGLGGAGRVRGAARERARGAGGRCTTADRWQPRRAHWCVTLDDDRQAARRDTARVARDRTARSSEAARARPRLPLCHRCEPAAARAGRASRAGRMPAIAADAIRLGQDLVPGASLEAASVLDAHHQRERARARALRRQGRSTVLRKAAHELHKLATHAPPRFAGIEVADLVTARRCGCARLWPTSPIRGRADRSAARRPTLFEPGRTTRTPRAVGS